MSFTSLSAGGLYRDEISAAIGIVNGSISSIGLFAGKAISNINFTNGYGCSVPNNPGTIKDINHCAPVKRLDGSNPLLLSPYIAVYFWRRTS